MSRNSASLRQAATDRAFEDAFYVAGLLVVVKFQDLIRRAAPRMRELRFPILATAHEYEFIYETRPATGR